MGSCFLYRKKTYSTNGLRDVQNVVLAAATLEVNVRFDATRALR